MPDNESAEAGEICLNSFKQHWAESQIDGPMQTIARYDDVAKLLITIGGFLLAVLAGGYSVMVRDLRPLMNVPQTTSQSRMIFVAMLVFFISAAAVCFPQPKMRAAEIMKLRKDADLEAIIHKWCTNLGRVILVKKMLLGSATVSFIFSFLAMMILLSKLRHQSAERTTA
jgi:hypothetical protein